MRRYGRVEDLGWPDKQRNLIIVGEGESSIESIVESIARATYA